MPRPTKCCFSNELLKCHIIMILTVVFSENENSEAQIIPKSHFIPTITISLKLTWFSDPLFKINSYLTSFRDVKPYNDSCREIQRSGSFVFPVRIETVPTLSPTWKKMKLPFYFGLVTPGRLDTVNLQPYTAFNVESLLKCYILWFSRSRAFITLYYFLSPS